MIAEAEDAGEAASLPTGLWMSISDIARARGVAKSSISRRVDRLVATGFADVRMGPGGQKLVNLAAFDRLTKETTDAVREANGVGGSRPAPRGSGLAMEQARRTSYLAEMARLDLEERQGKLVAVNDVHEASARVGETIVRILNGLPLRANEIAEAVAKEGVHGVRDLLKAVVYEAQQQLATELEALAEKPEGLSTAHDTGAAQVNSEFATEMP